MSNTKNYSIVIFILLFLTSCISNAEIERRILASLPINMMIDILNKTSKMDCLITQFNISEIDVPLTQKLLLAEGSKQRPEVIWSKEDSINSLSERLSQFSGNTFGSTIGHSKNCFKKAGITNFDFFYEKPVFVNWKHHGEEIIFIFQDNLDTGWYIAGGA